jgi:hypothetical protein
MCFLGLSKVSDHREVILLSTPVCPAFNPAFSKTKGSFPNSFKMLENGTLSTLVKVPTEKQGKRLTKVKRLEIRPIEE